jgi:AcrR family transcriptional regulator
MSDRRAEVLEAAKAVFVERGVQASTVREIGARAGILSGSLYHHFESKAQIVDEILSSFCTEVLENYCRISKTDAPAVEHIRMMVHYALSLIPKHSAAVLILLNSSQDLVQESRFSYLVGFDAEVEQYWTEAVEEGIHAGTVRAGIDSWVFYRFARDAILGAIRWYRPSGTRSIDQLAGTFDELILSGLCGARLPE